MKAFFIGLVLGIIVGAGGFWFLTVGRTTPAVEKLEERAVEETVKAIESTLIAGEHAGQVLEARLEALQLRAEDIQEELAEQGQIVRRRARDIGEAAVDAAVDARATAAIKAKLAADPDLSALDISVATSEGRVTLSGAVDSPELIGKATALALETDGVREVVSTLQVE